VNARQIIRLLNADGWFEAGQDGSPLNLKHPPNPERSRSRSMAPGILKIGTLKSIERLSGVNLTRRS
jgi:predicted RNA binding protein YcfA (HicA-like mRNA interferase family)